MVSEDVPADDVRLAAGQSRHDRLQVALYNGWLSGSLHSPLVQAGRRAGLHDNELGRVVRIQIREISDDRGSKGADAGLYEYVGRPVDLYFLQLFSRLAGDGSIALHDPGRDVRISFPCGILHDDTVLCLGGLLRGDSDAVIVIDVLDRDGCAFLCDVVVAAL